jgi:Tfp pilus assembly protein PilN
VLISGFNLARTNYRRTRRDLLLGGIAVAVLGLLLLGQIATWAAGRGEREAVAQRLARMDADLQRHQEQARALLASVPGEAVKRYEERVKAYNMILEASAFSWMGLLVELERSVPPSVFLSEIQPDLSTGRVLLNGVARSFDDLSLLLHGLEQGIAFRDVYLLRQTEQKPQAGLPAAQQAGKSEELEFAVSLMYGAGRK